MVRLVIALCSLHSGACHRVDPMYSAMPAPVCNMRQMQLAEVWAERNPELIRGQRLGRTMCVPVHEMQVGT